MTPVALVTGAAGGIGRAVVTLLRAQGMRVAAADLTLAALPCTEVDFLSLNMDVAEAASVHAGVRQTLAIWGRLDHVVHLAGRAGRGPLTAVTLDEWQQLLAINLTSAFVLAQAIAAPLATAKGTYTLMASSNALNGGSALSGPAYAVSKAGVLNFMRYLAKEWAGVGVRVNALAPGPIDTPMVSGRFDAATLAAVRAAVPLGRLGTAAEVAAAVGYLISPQAGFITGTVMNVSGGLVLD